jgi:hypothetical protein
MGERKSTSLVGKKETKELDTFGGRIHVEWDPAAVVTPLENLAFFMEFLNVNGLFDAWVTDCPLFLRSNDASDKRTGARYLPTVDSLGRPPLCPYHRHSPGRYSPELLGIEKLVSEDAAHRALARMDESLGLASLEQHLSRTTQPLLDTPWILYLDATVKCLYGKQKSAVAGYNPKKPGRPSHSYHSKMMVNARLALVVEVMSGNETAPLQSMHGIWTWAGMPYPRCFVLALLRGDNESALCDAEARDQPYLTKLRVTKNVKSLIQKLFHFQCWEEAG